MPRSSSSRIRRTTSLRISNAVVAEVAHASALLLRAAASLPHCAADGARAALAADCRSGRECGTDRGRLHALPPAIQARWGSISANPKITFPIVNRSFRKKLMIKPKPSFPVLPTLRFKILVCFRTFY
jgi:hypothetical protein